MFLLKHTDTWPTKENCLTCLHRCFLCLQPGFKSNPTIVYTHALTGTEPQHIGKAKEGRLKKHSRDCKPQRLFICKCLQWNKFPLKQEIAPFDPHQINTQFHLWCIKPISTRATDYGPLFSFCACDHLSYIKLLLETVHRSNFTVLGFNYAGNAADINSYAKYSHGCAFVNLQYWFVQHGKV